MVGLFNANELNVVSQKVMEELKVEFEQVIR